MRHRHLAFLLAPMLAASLSACSGEPVSNPVFKPVGSDARVRVVNASAYDVTVRINSVTVAGQPMIWGVGTPCHTVNSTTSGLSVVFPSQTIAFGGSSGIDFIPGEIASVFAVGSDSAGRQLIRVPVETTSTGGAARLLVLNVSGSGPYDAHVTPDGAPLGAPNAAGVAHAVVGSAFSVAAGQRRVRITTGGTQSVKVDLGNRTFLADTREVLLLSPPAPGASMLKTFFWDASGC
jgi:hypothetical protein